MISKINISVIGAGYVGLTTASCFAKYGHFVTCYDCDNERISQLQDLIVPIYEPDLENMIKECIQKKTLKFSNSLKETVTNSHLIFICVGTPQLQNNEPDLSFVWNCAHELKECPLQNVVVILKSTVPVGTTHKFHEIISSEYLKFGSNNKKESIQIAFCPEFLKQGAAVRDTLSPERIIIGSDSEYVQKFLKELYAPFMQIPEKIISMPIKDAELTKYAANAMLATKISFINEIALICDNVGVDIENISLGIGTDSRIGPSFLRAGIGYGGSCFPKDINALISLGQKYDINCDLLKSVCHRNAQQKKYLLKKIFSVFGNNLKNLTIACWGLSFKPETDDLRDAPSLDIITALIEAGAVVHAFDPVATKKTHKWFSTHFFEQKKLVFFGDMYECIKNVDALVLITEWKIFKEPNYDILKENLSGKYFFDGRNQFEPAIMEKFGISYFGIGKGISNEI